MDLFLCETLSSVAETRQATETAAQAGGEVWTALCVDEDDGTRLRGGEPLLEAADAARRAGAGRVLINCAPPEATTTALALLLEAGFIAGAYANGFATVAPMAQGSTVDALSARRDLDPKAYADIVMDWVAAGADAVGGCCAIGPAHIAEISRRRDGMGHLAAITVSAAYGGAEF